MPHVSDRDHWLCAVDHEDAAWKFGRGNRLIFHLLHLTAEVRGQILPMLLWRPSSYSSCTAGSRWFLLGKTISILRDHAFIDPPIARRFLHVFSRGSHSTNLRNVTARRDRPPTTMTHHRTFQLWPKLAAGSTPPTHLRRRRSSRC